MIIEYRLQGGRGLQGNIRSYRGGFNMVDISRLKYIKKHDGINDAIRGLITSDFNFFYFSHENNSIVEAVYETILGMQDKDEDFKEFEGVGYIRKIKDYE